METPTDPAGTASLRVVRVPTMLGAALIAATLAAPVAARAQEPGLNPAPARALAAVQRPDGFLFTMPRVSLGLRAGFNFARAGSDVFDDATSLLTLKRADFGSFMVAGDLGITMTDQIDLVLGAGYASASKSSEFEEYEDTDGFPITQRTTFSQAPLTVMVRGYLLSRGQQVGRFAWIPAKFSPYAGVGAGYAHFLYRQTGSFVDFVDLSIFDDTLESTGWTPLGIVNAGADYSINPRAVLTTDLRYQFGSGDLNREFIDFTDGLDLTGFQLSMGVRFRF